MNSQHPFISAWWRDLDDHEARFEAPSTYQEHLLRRASEMLADGLIDALEHFDMCELVRAATAHAVEEKLSDFLKPNGQYQLLDSTGQPVGRMDGYGMYLSIDRSMHNRAIAKRGATAFQVTGFALGTTIGCIRGQTFHRVGLAPLRLRLVTRRVNGELITVHPKTST